METLLFLDDDLDLLLLFKREFSKDYNVFTCTNTVKACNIIQSQRIDYIFTDIQLQNENGIDFIKKIKTMTNSKILVCSGSSYADAVKEACALGISGFIIKRGFKDTVDTIRNKIESFKKPETKIFSTLYLADDVILEENSKNNKIFLIKSGKARVSKKVEDKDIVLGYLEKGEYFGEISLFNGTNTTAKVSAETRMELDIIPEESLTPEITRDILRNVLTRFKDMNERLALYSYRENITKKMYNKDTSVEILYFEFRRLAKLLILLTKECPNIADLSKNFNEISGQKMFDVNVLLKLLLNDHIITIDENNNKVKCLSSHPLHDMFEYLDRTDKVIIGANSWELAHQFKEQELRKLTSATATFSNTALMGAGRDSYKELKMAGFFKESISDATIFINILEFNKALIYQKLLRKLSRITAS